MSSTVAVTNRTGWYHGWNVVAAALIAQVAAVGLSISSLGLFAPHWAHDLHVPMSEVLFAVLPMSIAVAITSPTFGVFADRHKTRPLFAAGLGGLALFSLLISQSTKVWQIWLLYGTLRPRREP